MLRDPTRGGLATTLNEIALQTKVGINFYEESIPINSQVQAASELLGFDPLYIANEGKLIVIVPAAEKEAVLTAMQNSQYGKKSVLIGEVVEKYSGPGNYENSNWHYPHIRCDGR